MKLLITSYLESEHVERIGREFPQIEVIYRPDLLGKPRYIADHSSNPNRTPDQETEWRGLLAQADILFDFDYFNLEALPELAPNVKWIQSSSAGIGQMVRRHRYAERTQWVMTTASGIHARPLAEFALMAMLMFAKNWEYLESEKRAHHWARYCAEELDGRTLVIIGLGKIGQETARLARAFGMRVIGTRRDVSKLTPHIDEIYPQSELHAVLAQAHYLVLSTPHTDETDGMIGAAEIARLPRGAVIINVARGAVIDQAAMTEALKNGHLRGAALDVFTPEPLPADDPLWDMPNVIISPHSASTADSENAKLVDLFCDNLRRYLNGEPMRNVLDTDLLY